MSGIGYRVLGYAVWHGRKRYLRRRLRLARRRRIPGLDAWAALTAAAVAIARRASS
jgi:membrane protein required for beta-lactamase induction